MEGADGSRIQLHCAQESKTCPETRHYTSQLNKYLLGKKFAKPEWCNGLRLRPHLVGRWFEAGVMHFFENTQNALRLSISPPPYSLA
jgi:hypothetical protein